MDLQALSTAGNAGAKQLVELLRAETVAFLDGHAADILALGEDAVKAILAGTIYAKIGIAPLASNASMEQIVAHEANLLDRDRVLQLVAAAQLKDSHRVNRLRSDAGLVAGRVASGIAVVGLTLLRGVLMG